MDAEYLSSFMISTTCNATKRLSNQKDEKDQKFSTQLAQLQIQYKEQLELCVKLAEELKILFSKHKIATERVWLLGEEISLLVQEQIKRQNSSPSRWNTSCGKTLSELEMNSFPFPKDEELFASCP